MKEQYLSECGQKYPMLEQFQLTRGVVGGLICQIASFIERLNNIEQSVSVVFKK